MKRQWESWFIKCNRSDLRHTSGGIFNSDPVRSCRQVLHIAGTPGRAVIETVLISLGTDVNRSILTTSWLYYVVLWGAVLKRLQINSLKIIGRTTQIIFNADRKIT